MKKLLLLLTLLLLIAGSFYLGRFTAPAPRFEASESATDEPLDAAFETFIQAQRDTLTLYKAHENFDDPLAAAEAYRGLLYTIVGSIKAGALMSHDYPALCAVSIGRARLVSITPITTTSLPYSMTMAAIAYQASEGILTS